MDRSCRSRLNGSGAQTLRGTDFPPMRTIPVLTAALLLGSMSPPDIARAETEPKSAKCGSSEFRQFDFWAGDWDTYDLDAPDKIVARNRVEVILDGCALREVYDQSDGLHGESLNIWDPARKVWHQTWVTNRGQLLVLEGGMRGDRMILEGSQATADGHPGRLRAIWQPRKDGVRETAEISTDGGKTWKPLFDIVFRRHPEEKRKDK